MALKLEGPIPAVVERADFGPAYNGEGYVTLTFRVPKDTPALVGRWELKQLEPGTYDWAKQRYPIEDAN